MADPDEAEALSRRCRRSGEPVAHADLVIRAEDEAAAGTPTADVIDLATGLHTLVFANGAVHGRFGLTDDTAATVAGCLRAGRHRLIDEGPDGRRLFIRVVPDGKTALGG